MPTAAPAELVPKEPIDQPQDEATQSQTKSLSEDAPVVSMQETPVPPALEEVIDVPPIPFGCPTPKHVTWNENEIWGPNLSFWREVEASLRKPPSAAEVKSLALDLTAAMEQPGLLFFDDFREQPDHKFIAVPESESLPDIWFLGDLHGDLLGLLTALRYVATKTGEKRHVIAFLGDLFDRGKYQQDVLFEVLRLVVRERGRYAFIVGNHDEGLRQEKDGSFTSSVQPCEFVKWLNDEPQDSPWRELAKAAIAFFAYAPCAVLLPDGLLMAHGGVPHVDRQKSIHSLADLNQKLIIEDFVWTRLHDSAKHRIPNRTTRGCSLGINDFDAFCVRISSVLHRPMRGMIRGHDHLAARYAFFAKYRAHPVLTINTICYRQDAEILGDFHRPAVVAEWKYGEMPTVHAIQLPSELIDSAYGSKTPVLE